MEAAVHDIQTKNKFNEYLNRGSITLSNQNWKARITQQFGTNNGKVFVLLQGQGNSFSKSEACTVDLNSMRTGMCEILIIINYVI